MASAVDKPMANTQHSEQWINNPLQPTDLMFVFAVAGNSYRAYSRRKNLDTLAMGAISSPPWTWVNGLTTVTADALAEFDWPSC